jgi:hypothetical protein
LTAVLELRPSRRKAAALERVRAEAEGVFWRVLSDARCRADHWAEIAEKRRRRTALEADLNRAVIVAAARAALAEPVAQGLARDAKRAVSSYIELRAAGWEASWPCPQDATAADHVAALHCGFMAHADLIAAVNIARRGVAMEEIAKGAKLAPLEQDMIARLWSHGDGGLGPLMARDLAVSGLVAAHVSAVEANDSSGLTSMAGHDGHSCAQNVGRGVFAERSAQLFATDNGKIRGS